MDIASFAQTVTRADGAEPFNEATMLAPEERDAYPIYVGDDLVALALTHRLDDGRYEAELAVHPDHRRHGHATALLKQLQAHEPLVFWAHGNLISAQKFAEAQGYRATRTLYVLERALGQDPDPADLPAGMLIRPFDEARDAEAWVALNARIFADHPEQGKLTLKDLQSRIAQPWFSAENFLVLESGAGELIGYHWLKVTEDEAETYVVGVAPEAAGSGLGKQLMHAGQNRLRQIGRETVVLYVDGDNERAVNLYRGLGFTERFVDVQYEK